MRELSHEKRKLSKRWVIHRLPYIMQRGGWEDDTVLKSVYRHAMDQEQSNMNKKANIYFEQTFMQHEMQHKTKKAL